MGMAVRTNPKEEQVGVLVRHAKELDRWAAETLTPCEHLETFLETDDRLRALRVHIRSPRAWNLLLDRVPQEVFRGKFKPFGLERLGETLWARFGYVD